MRKGSVIDLIVPIIFIIFFVFISFFGYIFATKMTDGIRNSVLNSSIVANDSNLSTNINNTLNLADSASSIFPNSIAFLMVGLYLGALFLAWRSPSNAIFFPIAILLMAIFTVMSILATNMMYDFISSTPISSYAEKFGVSVNFIKYFPHISAVFGFVLLVVLYRRGANDGNAF